MNKVNVELSLGDAKDVYNIMELRLQQLEKDREFFLKVGNEEVVKHLENEIRWTTILQRKFDV